MANEILEKLPADVRQALSHGFVFLIQDDLIQHFPARGWSEAQILDELYARYQVRGTFRQLGALRLVELPGLPELTVVVP